LPDVFFILYFPGIITSAIFLHLGEKIKAPENMVQKPEISNQKE